MEVDSGTADCLSQIVKLRQRLCRLIKLGESHAHSKTRTDVTSILEESVRSLFSNSMNVDQFIVHVEQILNVSIRINLIDFFRQTISKAHDYLKKSQSPLTWDEFKHMQLEPDTKQYQQNKRIQWHNKIEPKLNPPNVIRTDAVDLMPNAVNSPLSITAPYSSIHYQNPIVPTVNLNQQQYLYHPRPFQQQSMPSQIAISNWQQALLYSSSSTSNHKQLRQLNNQPFNYVVDTPEIVEIKDNNSAEQTQLDSNRFHRWLMRKLALNMEKRFQISAIQEQAVQIILSTLHQLLLYLLQRLKLYTSHRANSQILCQNPSYVEQTNVREQMRFLSEIAKLQREDEEVNERRKMFRQGKQYSTTVGRNDDHIQADERRHRTREYKRAVIEELRQKEADATACLVLKQSRQKRTLLTGVNDDEETNVTKPKRLLRANLQDLISIMENERLFKRSKLLLYAYFK